MSRHNRTYALKALTPDRAENDLNLESHILSQLNHPRIPRFIEAFSHDGVDYLVQEFMNGYPLSYYIVNGKRFTEEETKRILFQLLEILAYLHEPEKSRLAVIHRDLRLSNLFWFEGRVYLVDFGCARYFDGKTEQPTSTPDVADVKMSDRRPGTRTYALLRKEVSPRSDLFGAGVVGLDLFTNWIEDEALFQKPWQAILPASDIFKSLIETLLSQETQSISAVDILKRICK
ncbi:MAG: Serine/threonine-protein kinase B [Syntrophorhabdus sp. PtaU1.Bin002]|nr:MAG: Serine/threonine-protein kinase B [Syntrophorhabdus sp. PtaB.Bin006]OPY69510.1 MAG: Serine/threonine-protein kinase B [Syntrophorhabdus sp. PtaU1.Bin002]